MEEPDFLDLVSGKLNGQMAFLTGKLKVAGDMGSRSSSGRSSGSRGSRAHGWERLDPEGGQPPGRSSERRRLDGCGDLGGERHPVVPRRPGDVGEVRPGGVRDPARFRAIPRKVWEMLSEMVSVCGGAEPNAAHQAMAALEKMGVLRAVITQNVDGLHQAAGSRRVIEYHGNMETLACISCWKRYPTRKRWTPGTVPCAIAARS